MDERLEAGRLHLTNGEGAVRQGYPDDARMYFEAALLQFRGPELRLGEAHALRGLAQVATLNGDPTEAERHARGAVQGYRELHEQLEHIDQGGVSQSMSTQARMGEAASLVLLGELLVRRGARDEARSTLSHARVLGAKLGHFDAVAGVWNMLARLAMREGRYDEARDSMERALTTYRENRSQDGEVGTLLLIAEVERLRGDVDAARAALALAEPLSQASSNPMYAGRVLAASAALALHGQDLKRAESLYVTALPLVRAAGDQEVEGYTLLGLGEVASRSDAPDALERFIEGARVLADLDHQHGLGGAMLRISEHSLRTDNPEIALAAADLARRFFERTDPVRGVGQSGRLLVKALAALGAWRAVILVAAWRVDVVGDSQPTAGEVLEFYRARAPGEWMRRVSSMTVEARGRAAVQSIASVLGPVFDRAGAVPVASDDAVAAVESVALLAAHLSGYTEPEDLFLEEDTDEQHPQEPTEEVDAHGPAVLVLEHDDAPDLVWQRPPSEFDLRQAPTSDGGIDRAFAPPMAPEGSMDASALGDLDIHHLDEPDEPPSHPPAPELGAPPVRRS